MWSLVLGAVFGTPILIYVLFAIYGYSCWKEDFPHRKARVDANSPSYVEQLPPALSGKMRATTKSNKHQLVRQLQSQEDATHKGASAFKAALFRKRKMDRVIVSGREREMATNHLTARDPARKLDMDHVYLSLRDFLWAWLAITPNCAVLYASGVIKVTIRRWLKTKGVIKGRPSSTEIAIAEFILETTLATYVLESEEDQDGNVIGRFVWVDVPLLYAGDKMRVFERLTIIIDLTNRRWRSTQLLGHGPVGARDTLCMLGFILVVPSHVKLHSYANWAIDLESKSAFVRRMFVVSLLFNYLGFNTSTTFLSLIHKAGTTSSAYAELKMCFVRGVDSGMHNHSAVRSLATCSDFVHFIIYVRRRFLQCFTKYTEDFPSTSGEALFLHTVMHGLDHANMADTIKDPLWFEAEDPAFQNCAEMAQIVRACFVDDVPFLAFNRKFKNARHPFYREVYKYATTVNQRLADSMDCCIVK